MAKPRRESGGDKALLQKGQPMEKAAAYRIRVDGEVAKNWADRLEDMRITTYRSDEGQVETMLEGRLRDQAALAGVLETLYELHLAVLSVECLEREQD